jgi:hypothetical protein
MDSESDFSSVLLEAPTLLRRRLHDADALLMRVRLAGAQSFTCNAEKIYSRRFEGAVPYTTEDFLLSGASPAWGNVTLEDGERALVFVSRFKNEERYYQQLWRGHFTVKAINGQPHAIANWHLLLEKECGLWQPEYLRRSAFLPDASKPSQVAMPYSLLERHLLEELALVDSGHGA